MSELELRITRRISIKRNQIKMCDDIPIIWGAYSPSICLSLSVYLTQHWLRLFRHHRQRDVDIPAGRVFGSDKS